MNDKFITFVFHAVSVWTTVNVVTWQKRTHGGIKNRRGDRAGGRENVTGEALPLLALL